MGKECTENCYGPPLVADCEVAIDLSISLDFCPIEIHLPCHMSRPSRGESRVCNTHLKSEILLTLGWISAGVLGPKLGNKDSL